LPPKDSEEPSGALALGATGYLLIVPTWQWKITKCGFNQQKMAVFQRISWNIMGTK
jgi:hypothetical protein